MEAKRKYGHLIDSRNGLIILFWTQCQSITLKIKSKYHQVLYANGDWEIEN